MPQVVEVTVRPQLEHYGDVVAHIADMIEETKVFPGCLGASMTRDIGSYQIFVTHNWDSIAALDHYLETRASSGDFDFFSRWLMDEPSFKTFAQDDLQDSAEACALTTRVKKGG
ncbi:Antibiotic biosynthesis monooxygenase [Tritonibacter multivorans]|uniref:Antibiotic biosynthesis monooxygenase n=1 Tax=Tritonibacter multivorans TaxID=928856 RepID=A0A0N7M0V4_9RHOB|nr:Antibiotic biosynthesis monooxygenase [Tritonibacter multivorans]SFC37102.1 Antibiotic biosynthesis monooxygenase [Tritonibacter multivorans]